MQFSTYQQDFFSELETGRRSIVLEAVAGSGKTTTIVEAARRIPPTKRVLLIAFNKSIADELKRRVPKHIMVSTFHALGYGVWRRYAGGNVEVKDDKTFDILDELIPFRVEGNRKIYSPLRRAIGPFVRRLAGLAKDEGVGVLLPDEPETYFKLIEHHDLYIDVPLAQVEVESYEELKELAIEYTQAVLKRSREIGENVVDFSDMLWLPLVEELRTWFRNDYVFIDEAQDVSATQRAILHLVLKPNGRLIAVGDRAQAIYGWRGAASNSIDAIKNEFGCVELPLSITYRCAKNIVARAQEFVPQIEAAADAQDGIVEYAEKYTAADFGARDAILCRTTAPLIEFAYWLINQGHGCKVLGRDIGQGLAKLIDRLKAQTIEELELNLEAWSQREIAKAEAKDDGGKAARIADQAACVQALIDALPEDRRSVKQLRDQIEGLFSDSNGVTICSTIHKAKGLEWSKVWYLEYDRATPWARQPWQQKEERNLQYVATTRAKQHLIHIRLDDKQ